MIPLSSPVHAAPSGIAQAQLTWSRICHGRTHELRQDHVVVGTVQKPRFWSSIYLADTIGGHWKFQRMGFFYTRAEILDAATGQTVAQFKQEWGSGGVLTFADGQTFSLKSTGWLHLVWRVTGESGQPVLELRAREKTVDVVAPAPADDSRLSLLILFTLYRMLQADEDATSGAVVAAVIS